MSEVGGKVQSLQETVDESKRVRTYTEKQKEQFLTRVSKYRCELADIENLISIHIQNSATIPNEIVKLTEIQTLIVNEFERFQIKHEELCQFLEREHTTDSLRELETQHKDMQTVSIRVDRVLQKLKDMIDLLHAKSHLRG